MDIATVTFLLSYFCIAKAALVIEVQPSKITPGLTTNLVVNCSVINDTIPQMLKLQSLVLSRASEEDTFQELIVLKYNRFNRSSIQETLVPEGSLSINGESYISLTWPNPSYRDASRYRCDAHGVSTVFSKLTASAYASVATDDPDVRSLVDVVNLLRMETYQVKEALEELKHQYETVYKHVSLETTALRAEKERSRSSLFHVSGIHEGRRYYLSKNQYTFSVDSAQSSCMFFGGHLAQINSSEEFFYIKSFLGNFSDFSRVMVGISDLGSEGIWYNLLDKDDPSFLPWYPAQPDGGVNSGCAFMCRECDWRLEDNFCVSNDGKVFRYLCEVQEK